MSNQIWLPKDAALLKELREAANIDISALAIDYALSKTQIKQLEEGGDSSFYSPAIKLAVGRKLLIHFGVDDLPVGKTDAQNQTRKIKIPLVNLFEEMVVLPHLLFARFVYLIHQYLHISHLELLRELILQRHSSESFHI